MKRITLDAAQKAMAEVLKRMKTDGGMPVALCVADATGTMVAFARMDGVPERIAAIVTGKAYTAARMRKSTAAFRERLLEANMTLADFCDTGLTSLSGGAPVMLGETFLGAVGVSGRKLEEDDAIAQSFAGMLAKYLA